MAPTTNDAAEFVRSRLKGLNARLTQDELQALVDDLKAMMGRALNATDVASVVDAICEASSEPAAA
ncbi:MAG: hypothetical protein IPJ65_03105 [Archangiaceae bacterium]|nr:hypothetical protein [Archangiaceae bacterium]